MTIHRSYGEVEFHCDGQGCHAILETETRDWAEALETFKASDWTIRKHKGESAHICADCQQAESPTL